MSQISSVEQELSDFIEAKDSQLEAANSELVYGDGVYPGTKILRSFYCGDQWGSNAKRGGAKRTFNYCRRLVENNTAFLANEAPEISVKSIDSSDPIENIRAELIAKQLNEIHDFNELPFTFQKLVKVASITGVTFLFGPIWDSNLKQVVYKSFDNPENIRPIWRDSNFGEMVGFINRYRIDITTFKKTYEKQLKEKGITEDMIPGEKTFFNASGLFHDFKDTVYKYPMVEVIEYYDDQYYMLKLGKGSVANTVIDFKQHKYGFIPGQYLPNIFDPGSGRGTSDIEDVISAQLAYNEAKSNEEDIIAQTAYPQFYGININDFSYIKTREHGMIINIPENAKLEALPRTGSTFPVENYKRSIQEDIINVGGQNQVLFPGGSKQVFSSSGRAMSVMMQPINNTTALKKSIFSMALRKLNRNILILLEQKVPDAKKLINGNYNVQVFLSSILTRDVMEEINKFNGKIQSLTTTQKNLGIPSPSEEQKLMKEELKDPILGIETARQPGLIQQAVAMEQQQTQQMEQMMQEQLGIEEAGNQQPMLATETGMTQPMSVPQQGSPSPSTPQGQMAAMAQRNTGVNQGRIQ